MYSYGRKDCLESAETSLLSTFACICMCVFPFVIVIAQFAVMMCSINHMFFRDDYSSFILHRIYYKDIPFIFCCGAIFKLRACIQKYRIELFLMKLQPEDLKGKSFHSPICSMELQIKSILVSPKVQKNLPWGCLLCICCSWPVEHCLAVSKEKHYLLLLYHIYCLYIFRNI